jgi:putative CocE/NonD family hydrolase
MPHGSCCSQQRIQDTILEGQAKAQESYSFLPIKDYPWLMPDDRRVAPYFYDWVAHDTRDDYWKQWSLRPRYGDITVPALNVAGWYDVFLKGGIENFVGMCENGGSEAARNGQKLVIAPWIHLPWEQKVGELDFGPEAANKVDELQVRWFDHWLKGIDNGIDREPPVRVFVMGANRWREAEDWPIPETRFTSYYLHSRGAANTRFGNGSLSPEPPTADEPADRFRYDPANPEPWRPFLLHGGVRAGRPL